MSLNVKNKFKFSISAIVYLIFASLVFIRPFICQQAYMQMDNIYWLVLFILFFAWSFINTGAIVKNCYSFPAGLLVGATLINYSSGLHQAYFVKAVIGGLCAFFMASSISEDRKRDLSSLIIASAIVMSILAVYQRFIEFNYIAARLDTPLISNSYVSEFLSRKRVFATFCSPNILASFLAMAVCLSAGKLMMEKNFFNYAVVALISLALLLTQSVGAFLSLGIGLLILLTLMIGANRISFKAAMFILLAVFILILIILIMRFSYANKIAGIENSIQQRLYWWQTAVNMIKEHPIKGIGLGGFANRFHEFAPAQALETRYAHNMFLQIWAEQGILGLIGLLAILGIFLKRGFSSLSNVANLGVFMAGMAFIIHNMIDCSFYFPEASLLWWACIGLILSDDKKINK